MLSACKGLRATVLPLGLYPDDVKKSKLLQKKVAICNKTVILCLISFKQKRSLQPP